MGRAAGRRTGARRAGILVLALACACAGGGPGTDLSGDTFPDPTGDLPGDAPPDAPDARDAPDLPGDPGFPDLPADPADDVAPDLPGDPIPAGLDPAAFVLPPEDPAPPVTLPDGIPVRVATMNVYGFRFATPEDIGAWLATRDPDLVSLQEIDADGAARVAAAAGFTHQAAGDGKALLSRTPLRDPGLVPLDGARSLLHATTDIGGVPFSVYGAHVSWHVDGVLQARKIARDIVPADPLPHVVMAGDFNDEHFSVQITALEEALADAATAMGWYPGQHITWPSQGFDETEGSQTIDLVFFRRALPALVTGLQVANLSPVLSDHKPVVADLRYPLADTPFAADPFAPARDPLAPLPPAGTLPPNLLANPSAESGLDGWHAEGGAQAVTGPRMNVAPRTGQGQFTGYDAAPDPDAPWSRLWQDADLSGRAADIDAGRGRLYAAAWLASGFDTVESDGVVANRLTTYSDGEALVECRDAAGALLARVPSGRRDTLAPFPFAAAVDLPPGTRTARLSFLAHHKSQGGPRNGATADDLYLGFAALDAPHGTLGPDLALAGAEPGDPDRAALAPGWATLRDLLPVGPWGITLFPPGCASGTGCYVAHPRATPDGEPVPGPAALSVPADLSPWGAAIDAGGVALRWSARLRTFDGLAEARLALVVLDADGSTWAVFEAPPVRDAEWTRSLQRTRLPPGARRVRLEVRTALDRDDDTVFADDLSLAVVAAPAP